jgi:hypothetical protein
MSNIVNPVVVTTAFFTAILFTDLSQGRYDALASHALFGFFWILVVSVLCKSNMYAFAWLVSATPLLLIVGSLIIRDFKGQVAESKQIQYTRPLEHKYNPAPYFL